MYLNRPEMHQPETRCCKDQPEHGGQTAGNASEAPISQGLFCMGAWFEFEPDTAIDDVAASCESPKLRQINAAPSSNAPSRSMRSLTRAIRAFVAAAGMRRQVK